MIISLMKGPVYLEPSFSQTQEQTKIRPKTTRKKMQGIKYREHCIVFCSAKGL